MESVGEVILEAEEPPEKYITFKRDEFFAMMGYLALPPWRDHESGDLVGAAMDCAPLAEDITKEVERVRLKDAVVIRRQDYFAAPALNAYAQCIAISARLIQDDLVRQGELLQIADYFHQQAELAAEEGWKLPDL